MNVNETVCFIMLVFRIDLHYKIFESLSKNEKQTKIRENLLNKLHRSLESIWIVDYESQ